MENNSKRILLFDIDGTLLDPAGVGRVCFQRALEDVLGVGGSLEGLELAGRTDWQILEDMIAHAGIDHGAFDSLRDDVFDALSRHIFAAAPTSGMRSLPGVLPLLDRLANETRFILGLVTGNVRKNVPIKLRTVGINPEIFTFGAFGDENKDRNTLPALAMYRLSQMLGRNVKAENILVIGDTPHDIACARHTGLKILCVATGLYTMQDLAALEPDFLLEDFSDTPRVIEIFEKF